ncbi:tetratricopeptide repeat protein [Candidatus Omnitrophota bacterium]
MRLILPGILAGILLVNGCAVNKYSSRITHISNLVKSENFSEAEAQIKMIIRAYPEKPEPYYLIGLVNYSKTNYPDCIMNFEQAERRGLRESDDLLLKKGVALYHVGDKIESEHILAGIYEKKKSSEAAKFLGLLRYELGDYAGAIDPLTTAAASYESFILYHYDLGMSLFIEGRNAEALVSFQNALEIEPENPDIIFLTANLYMLNNQPGSAVELYTKIKPESQYGEMSIKNSAEAYISLGEYDSAVQLLGYLADRKPGDYIILSNLSGALIKLGDFVSAVEILTTMYENDNEDTRILYNLGLAYEGLGLTDMSLQYLGGAVGLEPRNPDYHYAYGLGLSESGRMNEAAHHMETVLDLAPGHVNASNWIENFRNSEN